MSGESISYNFSSFIISYVSLSVIAGLFTYRVLNSFLDNIILPLLDISILPDTKFHRLTKVYNHKKTEIKEIIKKQDIQNRLAKLELSYNEFRQLKDWH